MNRLLYLIPLLLILVGCETSSRQLIRQAEYLYSQGDGRQLDRIIQVLEKGGDDAREAAYALGRIGDIRATRHLARIIEQRGEIAHEATEAIGMIGDTRAVPVLIQSVKNDFPEADTAIMVLGHLKDNRAVPVLMKVVEERRPYFVRAIDALGEIGDPRAVDLLVEALRKRPVDEPRNIQFRIINEDPEADTEKQRILTFRVPDNLPPKLTILENRIEPEGYMFFRYRFQDAEYDSLSLIPEFSVNNGINWHPASTEGRIDQVNEALYQGSIIWRSDMDNIPLSSATQLVFRLTPTDFYQTRRRGVPDIREFYVDSTEIAIRDIDFEVARDVTLYYYYPNPVGAYIDSFTYHYSTNLGDSWLPATVQLGIISPEASQDSMAVVWSTDIDMPNQDVDSVLFRVSSHSGNTFGRYDITEPFHVDNNTLPTIDLNSLTEGNIFDIEYRISDVEGDPVSLTVYYSLDRGQSWKLATLSGSFDNLAPDFYEGVLHWYADFDIISDRQNTVRVRVRPSDRDPGLFTDSRDFYLKDLDFSKLTQGTSGGFIELVYPVVESDTLSPRGEYSTDGGRTWIPASLTEVETRMLQSRMNKRVNWNFPQDISTNLMQIEAIGESLDKIGQSSVVPNLLTIARQVNSTSRVRRQQATEAIRLFEKKPDWIVEGLIMSLIHPDATIRDQALATLRTVDRPEVTMAINDYEKYWSDPSRNDREVRYLELELDQQRYLLSIAEIPDASEQDIVEFLLTKGLERAKSERFFKDLDVLKRRQEIRDAYNAGTISYKEYMDQLNELLEEARLRRTQERREDAIRRDIRENRN
ncbi:HEAT repeat domain-containing protein [candidate division KSB1 bacterium]